MKRAYVAMKCTICWWNVHKLYITVYNATHAPLMKKSNKCGAFRCAWKYGLQTHHLSLLPARCSLCLGNFIIIDTYFSWISQRTSCLPVLLTCFAMKRFVTHVQVINNIFVICETWWVKVKATWHRADTGWKWDIIHNPQTITSKMFDGRPTYASQPLLIIPKRGF